MKSAGKRLKFRFTALLKTRVSTSYNYAKSESSNTPYPLSCHCTSAKAVQNPQMPSTSQNNPLDTYIVMRRKLKEREYSRITELIAKRGAKPTTPEMRRQPSIEDELTELERLADIPQRTFDIFLSARDLKIKAFLEANPRPQATTCLHSSSELRRSVMRNGSLHVVSQCLACGLTLKRHRKADYPNWESMPVADTTLGERFYKTTAHWNEKVAAVHNELPPVIGRPSFDFAQFAAKYAKDHPTPINPYECLHVQTELTQRVYQSGSLQAVYQCVDCGKHIRAISKKQTADIQNLPPFKEDKRLKVEEAVRCWQKKHSEATEKARLAFNEETAAQITSGKIVVIDLTTFDTYYTSPEWARTRLRIMNRDSHRCQVESCSGASECVHHITYDRLGCENDLDLISLCHACHDLVHQKQRAFPFEYRLTSSEIKSLDIDGHT